MSPKLETLKQACKRVQREYVASRGSETHSAHVLERQRVFLQAIERGVSYRRVAEAAALAPGTVYAMVQRLGVNRAKDVDPFSEPVWPVQQ